MNNVKNRSVSLVPLWFFETFVLDGFLANNSTGVIFGLDIFSYVKLTITSQKYF